jgi:hypothetical protein
MRCIETVPRREEAVTETAQSRFDRRKYIRSAGPKTPANERPGPVGHISGSSVSLAHDAFAVVQIIDAPFTIPSPRIRSAAVVLPISLGYCRLRKMIIAAIESL